MTGLVVTFGGLYCDGVLLPVAPARLDLVVGWLAVGFLALWVGGILAGNAIHPLPAGARPAMRGQEGVAVLATVAGGLASVVVVQRLQSFPSSGPGGIPVVDLALLGAVLAWAGGIMMGHSMRRFVRRRRVGFSAPGVRPTER